MDSPTRAKQPGRDDLDRRHDEDGLTAMAVGDVVQPTGVRRLTCRDGIPTGDVFALDNRLNAFAG